MGVRGGRLPVLRCSGRRRKPARTAVAGCGVAMAGRGRLERAGNELFGKMVVLLFGGDAGPAPPWSWGRGLFGACWWCHGGVAGGAGLFLVEASWLQRATVLSRECAVGMVKVRE
jgi:hypothetical protein